MNSSPERAADRQTHDNALDLSRGRDGWTPLECVSVAVRGQRVIDEERVFRASIFVTEIVGDVRCGDLARCDAKASHRRADAACGRCSPADVQLKPRKG